jgi:excisionase family DNA binding protein
MEETLRLIQQAIPAIETWLRATVNDEVSKALQADREKRQFVKRYTREETCEILGISKTTLWAWTNDGRINAIRIGRKPMYTQEEIDRVLKK